MEIKKKIEPILDDPKIKHDLEALRDELRTRVDCYINFVEELNKILEDEKPKYWTVNNTLKEIEKIVIPCTDSGKAVFVREKK